MVLGIGTDIIEIARIKKAVLQKSFLEKTFTELEMKLFKENNKSLAGNFCAKEAVAKALGTGFRGFFPNEIEILRDDLGKPYIVLYNKAKEIYNSLVGASIVISISHCNEYAVAFVLIEN